MNKLYKVYKVDTCWDEYADNVDYIGAESKEDLINHIKEIFPDIETKIERADWMNDNSSDEITQFGKYKEGDIYYEPYFSDEQLNDLKEDRGEFSRIKETEHLFTDIPYIIIDGFGYIE